MALVIIFALIALAVGTINVALVVGVARETVTPTRLVTVAVVASALACSLVTVMAVVAYTSAAYVTPLAP